MRRTYRNRPDYRSAALCIISGLLLLALFAAPAFAADAADGNTAEFVVSEDGKTLTATAHLVQQNSFMLVKPGFIDDEALEPNEFSLVDADGNEVKYQVSRSTVSFDKGDYTLVWSQDISDNTVYAKFPSNYAVTVYLPEKYLTGHPVLGTVSSGGVISASDKEGFGSMVTYASTKAVEVKFYEKGRDVWLYAFLAVWVVVLGIVYARYRSYKNKSMRAGKEER